MHDRDQSRCNRCVERPRTRPPGDHHQMFDVGWPCANNWSLDQHGDQYRSIILVKGGSFKETGSRPETTKIRQRDHAWRFRYAIKYRRHHHAKSKRANLIRERERKKRAIITFLLFLKHILLSLKHMQFAVAKRFQAITWLKIGFRGLSKILCYKLSVIVKMKLLNLKYVKILICPL